MYVCMQAALAVKNFLEGFREAVAKVLDLDLKKVHVSNGDTACEDKSRIQLKLVISLCACDILAAFQDYCARICATYS